MVRVTFTIALVLGYMTGTFPLETSLRSDDTHHTGGGKTFSVRQVSNPDFIRSGPYQLAKAYKKFGVPLPEDLKNALGRLRLEKRKRSTGNEVTKPESYDVEYLTPVSIGTPGQVLHLDIDTGSSDLWVFSSETPSNLVNGQSLYEPAKSSTAQKLEGYTWKISYGDGSSSSGVVYRDSVTLGGLTVSSQAVEAATQVSEEFTSDSNNDGLLGLGFGSLNTVQPKGQKTWFENIMQELDSPIFTADLKAGEPGTYNFGYIDKNAHIGNISYVSVNDSNGYWTWTSPGYAIGTGALVSTQIMGIADTGTTLLLLPSTIVVMYYAQIPGALYDATQGAYTLPCSPTPPDFSFAVGDDGQVITIPGEYILYAAITSIGTMCFGGIQADSGIGFSIFGDVALKAAFVVFDGGKKRLGWASKDLS